MSAIKEFIERVDRQFDRERLDSFWELEESFAEVAGTSFPTEAINAQLSAVAANPSYMGDWRPNQMLIHRGRGFALSVWLFEASRQYVHTMPFHGMYAPLGKWPLRYTLYELPPGYDNQVFDPRIRITPIGTGEVQPGEVLRLRSDRYAYDFRIDTPVPVLKLTTAPFQGMEWLFNKSTGHAWQANDSELTATQLRVAAYILGKLADPQSIEPLTRLVDHSHHAVRWAAIQGLGRISRSAAMDKLTIAVNDPHPHIRRAAAKTLDQLKPKG
jgi:hypothetical protein